MRKKIRVGNCYLNLFLSDPAPFLGPPGRFRSGDDEEVLLDFVPRKHGRELPPLLSLLPAAPLRRHATQPARFQLPLRRHRRDLPDLLCRRRRARRPPLPEVPRPRRRRRPVHLTFPFLALPGYWQLHVLRGGVQVHHEFLPDFLDPGVRRRLARGERRRSSPEAAAAEDLVAAPLEQRWQGEVVEGLGALW